MAGREDDVPWFPWGIFEFKGGLIVNLGVREPCSRSKRRTYDLRTPKKNWKRNGILENL